MRKAQAVSRTINPLHFEDLEPHRFEDLVRQLAYGFRSWQFLEATGKVGNDGGVDIRGLEESKVLDDDLIGEAEEDSEEGSIPEVREWRIQCKRYKTIGPKLIRQIVEEAIPNPKNPPYGLIIAAACDVSGTTISTFHEERIKRGAIVGHIWTKAHLEDLLFQPKNDHLLFAYFGISLQTRKRSRLQKVQAELTLKRKLLRAFELKEFSEIRFEEVLIRDLEFDGRLLDTIQHPSVNDYSPIPRWFSARIVNAYSRGLMVQRFVYDGWVKDDGSWDFLLSSARSVSWIGSDVARDRETDEMRHREVEKSFAHQQVYEFVPEDERCRIEIGRLLPFTSILEVDPIGQPYFEGIHLFCDFNNDDGPFEDGITLRCSKSEFLNPSISWDTHKLLFGPLVKSHSDIEGIHLVTFLGMKDTPKRRTKSK
jgi:hypothetical protein